MKSIKRFWVMLFLLPIVFALGCGQSEVDMVKNAPFPLDKSLTFGKLFDTYKHIEKGEWKVLTSDRGQKFVEFRAPLKLEPIVSEFLAMRKELAGDQGSYPAEIAKTLKAKGVQLFLIAQFKIEADGKRFIPAFLGLEQQNSNAVIANVPITLDTGYEGLLRNNSFFMAFAVSARLGETALMDDIYAEFQRVFILKNKSVFTDHVSTYEVRVPYESEPNPNQALRMRTDYRMYYMTVEDVSVDELAMSICYTDIDMYELTDAERKGGLPGHQWDMKSITSVNIKSRVRDSAKYRLEKNEPGSVPNFFLFTSDKLQYSLEIQKLSPLSVKIRTEQRLRR